jgi:glutamate racemase
MVFSEPKPQRWEIRFTGSRDSIAAEIAPCFVADIENEGVRTDTVVLACTHPLLLDRLVALAPWPVDWLDPAPAIVRRVADLLGPRRGDDEHAGAEMIFASGRRHAVADALLPLLGGRVPA